MESPGNTKRDICRLWVYLGAIYGPEWAGQYGEVGGFAFDIWAQGLAGFTPGQIQAGVDACLQRPEMHVPNLPAFKQLCRASAVCGVPGPVGTAPVSRETDRKHMAALRRRVGL